MLPGSRDLDDVAFADTCAVVEADGEILAFITAYYAEGTLPTGGNSFTDESSPAAERDWTAADLLDPANAPPDVCPAGLTPLDCALTLQRPTIAVVVMGRSDALQDTDVNQFGGQYTQIVETILTANVIPVLTTIPGDPAEVEPYNEVILRIAEAYDIPLVNVWRIVNEAGPTAINPDLTLTSPPTPDDFSGSEWRSYGAANRKILVLRTLYQVLDRVQQ